MTIDGPAGAGKSTVARRLAERLGFGYVNSGAIYRAVAWRVLRGATVDTVLRSLSVEFAPAPGGEQVLVDGQDVTEALYSPAVSELAAWEYQPPEISAEAESPPRELGGPRVGVPSEQPDDPHPDGCAVRPPPSRGR